MFFEEYKIGEAKFKCTASISHYKKDDIVKLSSLNDPDNALHRFAPLVRNLRTDKLGNVSIATLKNFFVPV